MTSGLTHSHIRPRRLVVYLFTILSVSSLAFISISTLNYLEFYPAIGRVSFRISDIRIEPDAAANQSRLVVSFVVGNPASYRGFTLRSFDLVIYFYHQTAQNTSTLFKTNPLVGSKPLESPLGPNAEISSSLTVLLYSDQSAAFQAFNRTSSGRVVARAYETVELITFLDPIVGRIRLDNQEDLQML